MAKRKPRKKQITVIDSNIFASLYRARRPIPIRKLAKRVNISWPTAKKHTLKLEKLGVLSTKKTIRRTNVFIDPRFRKKIKKKNKRV